MSSTLKEARVIRTETARQPEVGKFDGSSAALSGFRNVFRAEGHERGLDPVTDLVYLKRACEGGLIGPALDGWNLSRDNYQPAWNALQQKYSDDYHLQQSILTDMIALKRLGDETHDICKRYRQVKVAPEHWDLLRIFWRRSTEEPIREYWLTMVTYGNIWSCIIAI